MFPVYLSKFFHYLIIFILIYDFCSVQNLNINNQANSMPNITNVNSLNESQISGFIINNQTMKRSKDLNEKIVSSTISSYDLLTVSMYSITNSTLSFDTEPSTRSSSKNNLSTESSINSSQTHSSPNNKIQNGEIEKFDVTSTTKDLNSNREVETQTPLNDLKVKVSDKNSEKLLTTDNLDKSQLQTSTTLFPQSATALTTINLSTDDHAKSSKSYDSTIKSYSTENSRNYNPDQTYISTITTISVTKPTTESQSINTQVSINSKTNQIETTTMQLNQTSINKSIETTTITFDNNSIIPSIPSTKKDDIQPTTKSSFQNTDLTSESIISPTTILMNQATTQSTNQVTVEQMTESTNHSITQSTSQSTAQSITQPTIELTTGLTIESTNISVNSTTRSINELDSIKKSETPSIKEMTTSTPLTSKKSENSVNSPSTVIDQSTKHTTKFSDVLNKNELTTVSTNGLMNETTIIPNLTSRSLDSNQSKENRSLVDQLNNLNITQLNFDQNISRTILVSKINFQIPCTNVILANYSSIKYSVNLLTVDDGRFNQVIKKNLSQELFNYDYDPRIGFKIRSTASDSMSKIFEDISIRKLECELNYSLYQGDQQTIRQQFILIHLDPKSIQSKFIPNFYKLFSSNQNAIQVKQNDTIKLECFAITYKIASSKYGFIWKLRTLNNVTLSKEEKETYTSTELINETPLEELDFKVIKSQLTITNIDLTNSGYHYCEYDSDSVRKSIGLFVEVNNVTLMENQNKEIEVKENSFVKFETEHSVEYPLKIKSKETFLLRFKITFNEKCNVTLICLRRMQTILKVMNKNEILAGSTISFSHKIESADSKDSGDYTLIVVKEIDDNIIHNYTTANLHERLKISEFNLRSLIVNVEDNVELNVFKSEKFYPNNDYTVVCHVASTTPTLLTWKWSSCKTDKECNENVNGWKIISNKISNSNTEDSGNNESLFKIIAINNEQINILDLRYQKDIAYACVSENEFGKTNVTFRLQPSDTDLSISSTATESNLFTNDNLTLFCNGIFHQEPNIIWLYQKDEKSPQVILTDKNIKNYSIRNKPEKKQIEAFNHEYMREYLDVIRYKFYFQIQSNLSIRGVQLDQNGLYFCKNEKNNKLSPVHRITAQIPVKANITNFKVDKHLETKVLLICSYVGNPEPMVKFSKDGYELMNATILNEPHESKIIIDVKKIKKVEESYYECHVKNRWAEEKRNLLVVIKPNLDHNPNNGVATNKEKQTSKKRTPDFNYISTGSLIAFIILIMMVCFIFAFTNMKRFCQIKNKTRLNLFKKSKKSKNNFGFAFYNSTAVDDDSIIDGSNNNLLMNTMLKSMEFTEDRLELGRVIGQGAYGIVVKAEAIGIEKSIKITTVAVKMIKDENDVDQKNSLISEIQMLLFLGKHLNIVNLLGIVTKNKLMAIVEYCRYGNMKNFLLANRLNFINMVNPENGELDIVYDDVKIEASNSSKDSGFSIKTPLKTLDLLNFVFQIARGMQYIHSKKLLHRDLAARNILLADNFIIKICDFGLSKDVYFDDMYVKKGYGKLPIKWMSYESIVDHLYTAKSDIWSFSIVCWEIFSLGSNPYPGIQTDEHFHKKLKNGYRMERPEKCPKFIYDIMSQCWHIEPDQRPNFDLIYQKIYELIDQSTKSSYVDINFNDDDPIQ